MTQAVSHELVCESGSILIPSPECHTLTQSLCRYSRDVVDGKANPNPDLVIMSKAELRRVIKANKAVKQQGFAE
jgi:hypothetical protein